MENKLEQLLNRLIEKGFRPFGRYDKLMGSGRFGSRQFVKFGIFPEEEFTLRELVSINSGLWQFVCENGMIMKDQYTNTTRIQEYEDERDSETYRTKYDEGSYLFRLIESALKDESELEDFLLQNIKVGND